MKRDALKQAVSIIVFLTVDIAAYHVGMWVAIWIRSWFSHKDLVHSYFLAYYDLTTVMIVLPALFFVVGGLYRRRWVHAPIEDLIVIIRAVALVTVAMLAVLYTLRADHLTRPFPTGALFISFVTVSVTMCGWRVFAKWITRRGLDLEPRVLRTLIVGPAGLDDELILRIRGNPEPRYELVGCLEDIAGEPSERVMGIERLGPVADFQRVVTEHEVDHLILVAGQITNNQALDIVHWCDRHGVAYKVIPTLMDMMTTNVNIHLINYIPMVHYGKPTIAGWPALFKRLFDIVSTSVALVMLAPLLLVVAAIIRMDSKGPAIFRQWRVGRGGHLFRIFKFRTMCEGAEKMGALTTDGDPRITRIGRFLRKTSIDELPQLFNVLLGQMSLVGPRAVVPHVADKFNDQEKLTLNVTPGLTGLAQVSGRDALGFYDKSLLNLYYIRNYSFLLDLKIVLKTIQVVLKQEGTEGVRITS